MRILESVVQEVNSEKWQPSLALGLTLLGQGGGLNQPALFSDGFFSMKISWLFLINYELSKKQKKMFGFFTVFWGDLEGVDWFSPPPPTLKQHPEAPPY